MNLIRRHEQLVVAAVFYMKIVTLDAADVHRHDAKIFADAVILVYDVVADIDFPEM